MPIREFYCPACETVFEELLRSADKTERVSCPSCGSEDVSRKISVFAARAGGGRSPCGGAGKGSSAGGAFVFGGSWKGGTGDGDSRNRATFAPPWADLCPGYVLWRGVRNGCAAFLRTWSLAGSERCQERCFGGALRRFPRTYVPDTSFFTRTLY